MSFSSKLSWVGMPLGSYTATRGWSSDQIAVAVEGLTRLGSLDDGGVLTAAGRAAEGMGDSKRAAESAAAEAWLRENIP